MENILILCKCATTVAEDSSSTLGVWVPAIVAVISLIVTTIFTVFVAPKIAAKQNQKTAMYNICSQFFDYLTDIVSLKDYSGVPSQVRKYSLKIHLMYKEGVAPKDISEKLEDIFQKVKTRKTLNSDAEITAWENDYRVAVRDLRTKLSKYVGVFKAGK